MGIFSKNKKMNAADLHLEESRIASLTHFKVLVLGAGESGKSTVLRQLKLINKIKFTDMEIDFFKENLRLNTLQSMQTLIDALKIVKSPPVIDDEEMKKQMLLVKSFEPDIKNLNMLSEEVVCAIKDLWKSEQFQSLYEMRDQYWLLDSVEYYFDNIERFNEKEFVPTEDDCVRARVITTGIVSTDISTSCLTVPSLTINYTIIDVGGQRAERKRWIHCFDDVSVIIWVANLNGYHSVLFEDNTVNRLHESLKIFESYLNNETFQKVPIVLILNKKDLFETNLKVKPLNKLFPEYDGGDDVMKALKFIEDQFKSKLSDPSRLTAHTISARLKFEVKEAWSEIDHAIQASRKEQFQEAIKGQEKLKKLAAKNASK